MDGIRAYLESRLLALETVYAIAECEIEMVRKEQAEIRHLIDQLPKPKPAFYEQPENGAEYISD